MVIKLLSADADTFEITAAEVGFTLAMEDAIAEKHPWLLARLMTAVYEYPQVILKISTVGSCGGTRRLISGQTPELRSLRHPRSLGCRRRVLP